MNRAPWEKPFDHTGPVWPCPACGTGQLHLVSDTLVSWESQRSLGRTLYGWEGMFGEFVFSCWLRCKSCREEVAVTGTGTRLSDGEHTHMAYQPLTSVPGIDVFAIPARTPQTVTKQLRAAFQLSWRDPGAGANRLRVCIERLLDYLKIPRWARLTNGRYEKLTLHKRIERYAAKRPDLGEQLMAIKWLGNTASHDGDVPRDDLLDGFEILEHTLKEMLTPPATDIKKLAKNLTRRHRGRKKR